MVNQMVRNFGPAFLLEGIVQEELLSGTVQQNLDTTSHGGFEFV
jgi:hypothetical protein